MRTSLVMVSFCVVALLTACGGSSPSAPSTPTGTVGARIDSLCSSVGVASVRVTIDGSVAGTAEPGGGDVTKVLPVGHHVISGVATMRPAGLSTFRWEGTVVTTAASPDSIRIFACV